MKKNGKEEKIIGWSEYNDDYVGSPALSVALAIVFCVLVVADCILEVCCL